MDTVQELKAKWRAAALTLAVCADQISGNCCVDNLPLFISSTYLSGWLSLSKAEEKRLLQFNEK